MNASVLEFKPAATKARPAPVIKVGENAWRAAKADAVSFLIDAAEYFACLEDVFTRARKTIWIVGWDFNPDIYLRPDRPNRPLGELLREMVERNPELEVNILVWAMGPIYSGKSTSLFRENTWSSHPRIHLQFDTKHPLRGSHHQKLVCVDDTIAFLGGIDLTARRWDTPDHLPDNPLRVTPEGDSYEPVHDIQAVLTGEAAQMIGDLARRRWSRATGQTCTGESSTSSRPGDPIWPRYLDPALGACQVALALTEPGHLGRKSRKDALRLTIDAIKAARRHIYIETQYLAHFGLVKVLEERLAEKNGPEIVIIVTRISHGFLEKVMMGGNRDRIIRRLRRADRHDRFRVFCPVVPAADGGEQDVLIHSKLLIVDDSFVRVGSSNINNRSEGLDTEADVALEAGNDACRSAIRALRATLIAEHTGSKPAAVAAQMHETGSLVASIEALNTGRRGLRGLTIEAGSTEPVWGTAVVDPKKPYWPLQQVRDRADALASRFLGIFM